jgi:hypothetical protein
VLRHVGLEHHAAPDARLEVALCSFQFIGSFFLSGAWVRKSYGWGVPLGLEIACAALCAGHSAIFGFLRCGFATSHAASLTVFLDCLTLPAVAMQLLPQGSGLYRALGGSWLTLAYLRTFHCWRSAKRLRDMNRVSDNTAMSDFSQEALLAVREWGDHGHEDVLCRHRFTPGLLVLLINMPGDAVDVGILE